MSKAALGSFIQKLNLQKGDILVCKNWESLKMLGELKIPGIDFQIPLVFAPEGIQKLNRQDLLNLLEQLEQPDKSVLPEYHVSAPL